MRTRADSLLLWSPRILGLAVALFFGMFALDAFDEHETLGEALPGFALHLAPSIVLLVIVASSWRRPWIGAIAFLLLAVLYAVTTWHRPDWIVLIAGPLLSVGVLFLVSWWSGRRTPT